METDFSYASLIKFLEDASDQGLIKVPTANSYRVAVERLRGELTAQELKDIRDIDFELVFQRFVNRNGSRLSADTLRVYRQRASKGIAEFIARQIDPASYRPAIGVRRSRSKNDFSAPTTTNPIHVELPTQQPMSRMLTIPFPLRTDFVVSVQIPRDLTLREADRIAAFVRTLAVDFDE